MRALYLQDCLQLEKIDRTCHLIGNNALDGQAAQIYQQVFGYAPTQDQLNSLVQDHSATNAQGQVFIDMNPGDAANFLKTTPQYLQKQASDAQTAYQSAIGTAVSGLQTAGTNLDTQYGDLLTKVLGQGTVAMNTVTTGENNLLASRGITNDSPLYSSQMGSAQLPVQVANQSAVGTLGYTQAGLKLNLANQIASLQSGAAGTMSQLPLEYGSLQLANAANVAQIALANAQAKATGQTGQFISTPFGEYDTVSQQFVSGNGNSNTKGMVYQNGQWYLNV